MPVAGTVAAIATLALAGLTGRFLLERVLTLRWMRRTSRNLVATRGGESELWLVAHTDSKSQTIGMLMRVGSITLAGLVLALMIGEMIHLALGPWIGYPGNSPRALISYLSLLSIVSIIPFTLCFVTNHSRGALDNASGVAAVLLALELIPRERNIGILLTSGEELALAGAKAFLARPSIKGVALNCDTIDDSGRFICMTYRRGKRVETGLVGAARSIGERVKPTRIIGVLTDSVAFADAGWETCTLSRGNLATLARVHTSGDRPGRIKGTGIALAARILAATIEELS